MLKDFNISISTENGTGSMTANKLLMRCLLSHGFKANSKNLFPSNIAGLPTTYSIRITDFEKFGHSENIDLYIGFNKKTLLKDFESLTPETTCILNADFKVESYFENTVSIECRKNVRELHESATTKKLLYNMLYVGTALKALKLDLQKSLDTAKIFFKKLPEDVLNANMKALELGYSLYKVDAFDVVKNKPQKNYIFEGNLCSALGFLDGGATVATWYPITPSSSVVESFESLNARQSKDKSLRSVLQCEDEISSAVAALGAGWSGARAFTATSGPGLSLMQEAIGLGYFTESPFVILDVQRSGPSTGLPTRTSQADLVLAHYSSHGDTLHPVLLPGTPQEAYNDAFESLNLAEQLQTPVMVLSDLDLGMNEWVLNEPLKQKEENFKRGPVETKKKETELFKRFSNSSPVATRSLPRLSDPSLAYFTRGSGHDESGDYSEDPKVYEQKLSRLKEKVLSSKKLSNRPKDIIEKNEKSEVSIVVWGSTGQIYEELKNLLSFEFSFLRVRSLPVHDDTFDFLKAHKTNFVVELNRDGQLNQILKASSSTSLKMVSINQFGGLPANAKSIAEKIKKVLKEVQS